jgi:sugar phosphate isomerase/epimerase
MLSRRAWLGAAAATLPAFAAKKKPALGLELYSVRQDMQKDLFATVRAVAKLGYTGVEFYGPYYGWTEEYTKDVRKLIDELGVKCLSTHNGPASFQPDNYQKSIDRNGILGAKFIVLASAGRRIEKLDDWKSVAQTLTAAQEKFKSAGFSAGYHNHAIEFRALEGKRPIEVIAANTPKDVVLQLDVGTCVEAGQDPVAWIQQNPGRLRSIHCKEWSKDPAVGFKALFGEGSSPWKEIFKAAEKVGGVEHYLIEQEGSRLTPMESAQKCLENFKKMKG